MNFFGKNRSFSTVPVIRPAVILKTAIVGANTEVIEARQAIAPPIITVTLWPTFAIIQAAITPVNNFSQCLF